tara:strand:- start:258 stop:1163 length:906 start_codon:yes stop_codon:yes gene_type:complete
MSIKNSINKNLFEVIAKAKYPLPIWKTLNHKNVALFKSNTPELNEVQNRILSDLKNTGIATTSLDELFPKENLLETLNAFAAKKEETGSTNHKKKFLVDYWDEVVELDINNPFLKTALSAKIIDVVNSYMEMYTSLMYFTLQKTIPIGEGELTNSQNWHRDPQEVKQVKVFTYLNDIDQNSGPFTYVPHSAPTHKHEYAKLFPQQPPQGSYPGNGQVEEKVKTEDIIPMLGKAGTMIFCDTNGLHYGGVAKTNPRIMSTFGYSAHTYKENKMYYYDQKFLDSITDFSPQAKHSIRPQWKNK